MEQKETLPTQNGHDEINGDHSPTDDEKLDFSKGQFETMAGGELLPDPDAHLSEEEKIVAVSYDLFSGLSTSHT